MSSSNKSTKHKQKDPTTTPTVLTKSSVGNGGLADNLKTLMNIGQQIFEKHSKDLHDFDGLENELNDLRTTSKKQDKQIAELEAEKEFLFTTFQDRITQWDAKQKHFDNEVKGVREKCKAACSEKIQEAQGKVHSAETKEREWQRMLEERGKQLREAEAGRIGFQKQLETCRSEFNSLRNNIGIIELGDDLRDKFTAHEAELHNLAVKYCGIDLPDPDRLDSLFIFLHESNFLKVIKGAVPISNTQESKMLRVAALEANVTWWLAKYLFQPLFPWSSPPEDEKTNILEDLLDTILEQDPPKEAIVRSIISTRKTRDGEARKDKTITMIVKAVTKLCTPLLTLSQPSRCTEFERDLEGVLRAAVDVWSYAQRVQFRVMSTSEVDNKSIPWEGRTEHEQIGVQSSGAFDAVKAIYPHIYHRSGKENSTICSGFVLWSDQTLYITGRNEFRAQYDRTIGQNSGALDRSGSRRSSYPRAKHRVSSST